MPTISMFYGILVAMYVSIRTNTITPISISDTTSSCGRRSQHAEIQPV